MYGLSLHYLLADITLFLLVATTLTGVTPFIKRAKRWYKHLIILHAATGFLTLLFFLLTYLLAPKI